MATAITTGMAMPTRIPTIAVTPRVPGMDLPGVEDMVGVEALDGGAVLGLAGEVVDLEDGGGETTRER